MIPTRRGRTTALVVAAVLSIAVPAATLAAAPASPPLMGSSHRRMGVPSRLRGRSAPPAPRRCIRSL